MSIYDNSNTANTDKPTHTDGEPIVMGDNYGELAGTIHELKKYWKRSGKFQLFVEQRAVALPN